MQNRLLPVAVLFLALSVTSAPIGQWAHAKERSHSGTDAAEGFLLVTLFGSELDAAIERASIVGDLDVALTSLRDGDKKGFDLTLQDLSRFARTSKSQANRSLAKNCLRALPKFFVANVAYIRDDGTPVADPDPFIRHSLRKVGDLSAADGGSGGEGDD